MKLPHLPFLAVLGLSGTLLVSCGGGGEEVSEDNTMKLLEAEGFSFSIDEYQRAAREGNPEIVTLFHEAGMAVDSAAPNGMTALFAAAENGQTEVVSALVEEGAEVDVTLPGGNTPLLAAAANGHTSTAKVLLDAGANPEARDGHNWTPLTRAAFEGHSDTVKVLAPKSRTELDSALHLASVNGNTETIDALLNSGASVFARSNENKTALMYAAANGNFDVVQVLLQNGSNRFAIDENGKTPAQMAELEGHVAVADYLLEPPTDAERTMPEIPTFADLTPEKSEFTPLDDIDNPEVTTLKNENPGGSVFATRQPAPQRIDGTVVAMELPVEGASPGASPGASGAEHFEEGVYGEGDISEPDPVVTQVPHGGQERVDTVARETTASQPGTTSPETVAAQPGSAPQTTPIAQPAGSIQVGHSGGHGGGGEIALPQEKVAAVAKKLKMHDYRESQLPVMLDDVVGETATVRVLYGETDAVDVKAGEQIAETGLEVVEVRRRFITSKQGKGEAVNVSEIEIRNVKSGERTLVVKDVPAKANDTYALMSLDGTGDLYDVRRDDHFSAEVPDLGQVRFRVADIRPTQVILENTQSGESFTIPRTTYGL